MSLVNLRRWHWIVIGLLLGLAFGGLRIYLNDRIVESLNDFDTLGRADFEQLLFSKDYAGQRFIQNIRVTQFSDGRFLVTCTVPKYTLNDLWVQADLRDLSFKAQDWRDVRVILPAGHFTPVMTLPQPGTDRFAKYNNRPQAQKRIRETLPAFDKAKAAIAKNPKATIVDYLTAIQADDHSLTFTVRLWQEARKVMIYWVVGTLVVVGGIWPFVIDVLILAGLAPPRPPREEKGVNLRKVKATADHKPTAPKSTEFSQEDMDKLTALEKELEQQVAAEMASRPAAQQAPSAEAPVRKLTATGPQPPAAEPEKPQEHKDFGLTQEDFYPTEVHARKKP